MSNTSLSLRPRRPLAVGAAILLLHWLAWHWMGAQLRAPHPRLADEEPVLLLAQVQAAAPRPAASLPLPVGQAMPPMPAPPAPPPLPGTPVEPSAPASMPVPAVAGGDGQGVPEPGAGAQVVAGQAPPPAPAGAASLPAAPPIYKIDMPPAADITLDVARVDADGTKWSGEALLSWKLAGGHYKINVEAGLRIVFARVNLLVLTSEGAIADSGFAPLAMTEKRRGRSMTATHFNRAAGTITFSASGNSYALADGAQDKASVPLQLAAIARADPGQFNHGIDLLVAEDRDASVFHFEVLGQEQIDTRMGKLQAWHLSRPPKPGSYNSRLDIWLAPAHGWYPVQIRNLEASGAVTTQTVNNIVMTDTGS